MLFLTISPFKRNMEPEVASEHLRLPQSSHLVHVALALSGSLDASDTGERNVVATFTEVLTIPTTAGTESVTSFLKQTLRWDPSTWGLEVPSGVARGRQVQQGRTGWGDLWQKLVPTWFQDCVCFTDLGLASALALTGHLGMG